MGILSKDEDYVVPASGCSCSEQGRDIDCSEHGG